MNAPLHHIALGARDVERVSSFYRQVFGLEERTRHLYEDERLHSIWLDMGGAVLMVEHTHLPPENRKTLADGTVGEGPFLLAFRADDSDMRLAIEARAAAAGQPIESRSEFTSYFRDPEGNRVAVSTYPLTNPGAKRG